MEKRRMLLSASLVLVVVPVFAFAIAKQEGLTGGVNTLIRRQSPGSYILTISASDIDNGYALTTSGNRISFETSGVTAVGDSIRITKNGYLRIVDAINGTTSISIDSSSFSNDDKLMLQSGYADNNYGTAVYLTKENSSASTYYRTHFRFKSDASTVTVGSITINYTCETHYDFTPFMSNITEDVDYGNPSDVYKYGGLSYEADVSPDLNEVDIVTSRFELDLRGATQETVEQAYSIHPTVKYYDKGGCLIKQATGFWLCHVNPIIRFFTGKDKFESYTFVQGDSFDLKETSPIYHGVLSGFDWSEYTESGGVLTQPLQTSMDLYPKVTINFNAGSYSSSSFNRIVFTPDKNAVNYGFPSVGAPTLLPEYSGYSFIGWYNGEERYNPATASDFHDYDLYADYSSEYDLRIRFQNRGFNNPYLEIGVPKFETKKMPSTSTYVDQSTIGMVMGRWVDTETNVREPGYYVYPQGDREHGTFYEAGADFTNDGSLPTGTIYIAEPYIKYEPTHMFEYLDLMDYGKSYGDHAARQWIRNVVEHMSYHEINDLRTYFKKIVLPDSTWTSIVGKDYGVVISTKSSMLEQNPDGSHPDNGITDTKELEVVVGNDTFEALYGGSLSNGYGFMNNAELRRLEHFPSLREICRYTFWNCPKLEPLQNWRDFGPIEEIDEHAFDSCYVNPILNEKGGIIRRRFELPSSLRILGDYVFAKAVFTDFYLGKTNLTSIGINSFAYSDDSSHSVEFAKVLAKYNTGTADLAALKAVANHVYFNGSKAEFESLIGVAYNETDVLLNKEYYVTFNG